MTDASVQGLIDALPMPALAVDGADRIVAANVDARTLIGQQIVGRNYVTMLRQPAVLDAVERCLRDGTAQQTQYLSSDGAQDTTFHVTCRPVPPEDAGRGLVLLTFQDVTQVQQVGQMRRDFVANVSHELRTPLTAILGFIETLRGPARDDPAAQARFLDIMQNEAGRMNRLVGDLLSLSRVEEDERVRPTTRIDLRQVLEQTLHAIAPLAQEACVTIDAIPGDDPVPMTGDADQLVQVFSNLIENAIKYGGSGEKVRVDIALSDRDPALRAPGVRVRVTDFGPGIDPVHLPRLTERFYRADDHRSRALGGTGLGLAIVKHIINRHRGRLRVESDLGQGATFTVILPIDAGS